ncbi:SIR2 family NAD-dependent protein deacylase [Aquimarina latercula]|uniref:SIR2 family NAD-dependent protein deacylase n=1 Tax=Aquimarina latercula TaxID=987 RepID=UPI00040BD7AE|nr:Sir2 family NAD-dependent protein deacetylase [Aquimarina latercula]
MIEKRISDRIEYCLKKGKKISFLVGAGISAESGIPTFRGEDGYWVSGSKNYKAQEIGTKRFFNIASHEVLKFYLYRKSITEFAKPNQSHLMLKEIESLLNDNFALISQNVDSLHKKAGNSDKRTYLIHGDHDFMRCGDECSNELYPFPEGIKLKGRQKDQLTESEIEFLKCPKCNEDLRPHVLWFDEYYNEKFFKKDSVLRISKKTGILFVLGTSGETTLPQIIAKNVLAKSGTVVEININESYFSELLSNKANGIVINSKSTPFLSELKTEIEKKVITRYM